MGKQYNKTEKRKRRHALIKRRKIAARTKATKPKSKTAESAVASPAA